MTLVILLLVPEDNKRGPLRPPQSLLSAGRSGWRSPRSLLIRALCLIEACAWEDGWWQFARDHKGIMGSSLVLCLDTSGASLPLTLTSLNRTF